MLIGSEGSLRFTAAGRAHYAPLFAKYGFSISNISDKEQFTEALGVVTAGELDENTRELERLLQDPDITDEERSLIGKILHRECTPQPTRPKLKLVR